MFRYVSQDEAAGKKGKGGEPDPKDGDGGKPANQNTERIRYKSVEGRAIHRGVQIRMRSTQDVAYCVNNGVNVIRRQVHMKRQTHDTFKCCFCAGEIAFSVTVTFLVVRKEV